MASKKLTPEAIEALIYHHDYLTYGTLTICVMTLNSGAMVTGESNVIDPNNYDAKIGREMAYKDAFAKIWQLEGYAMKRDCTNW
ncbi:Gp49 family protein [Sediminimonas sp.]|uniref:Gp49 family protein n=1 Tax=Sediminimonas sp. TaxID=2823379 RepID=UPI0025E3A02B|nr:Gp49 family protein [Sediminimonas sp.]